MTLAEAKRLPATTNGRSYLVVGPNCWGRGTTVGEAYANARSAGVPSYTQRPWKFGVFEGLHIRIDDMGRIFTDGECVEHGTFEVKR